MLRGTFKQCNYANLARLPSYCNKKKWSFQQQCSILAAFKISKVDILTKKRHEQITTCMCLTNKAQQ